MLDIALRYLGCFLIGFVAVGAFYEIRYINAKKEVEKLRKELDELKKRGD
ncbi:DUF1049 domain-containing protein [Lactobacillus ruminis]|nr:LapA family protein [Ligilactobacillus ruminis]MSB43620.1 DUF1049 domain-containing protein [Ligilactobacillus ruminis]MSB54617.1 DUF1049 domain-containing protein [Ligilactobacillus ruminis]MSB56308.1 DUF1049 domain-containing protein [Ligilactobacillus ruminis]MSB81356.1 DUF1049 domain-containing protein [Ligilactobacillus ruminis]MSB91152.1 DUF1049 domain-containing protein [Ligilactobacillus ruminis]